MFVNQKTLILGPHNYKNEQLIEFLVDKNKLKKCFIVSNKKYYYDKDLRWYTPYERLVDFEFHYDTFQQLLEHISLIYKLFAGVEEKTIVIDIRATLFDKNKIIEMWDNLVKFADNITIIVCSAIWIPHVPINFFNNIFMDRIAFEPNIKVAYKQIKETNTINYDEFKILMQTHQEETEFYLLRMSVWSIYKRDNKYQIQNKQKIKDIISLDDYEQIKKFNGQPTKTQKKKWKKEDKINESQNSEEFDDWLDDGIRFS